MTFETREVGLLHIKTVSTDRP